MTVTQSEFRRNVWCEKSRMMGQLQGEKLNDTSTGIAISTAVTDTPTELQYRYDVFQQRRRVMMALTETFQLSNFFHVPQ